MTRFGLRKKIAFSFLFCGFLWLLGLLCFVHLMPREKNSFDKNSAEAIIVLTGGKGRLEYGLSLLADNIAPALFVSGAGEYVSVNDILKQAPANIRNNISSNAITLGHQAENTIGNAEETARWLTDTKYHKVVLVTATYHIPRSLLEFSQMLPNEKLYAAPVFPDDFDLSRWWVSHDDRVLVLSEYHKFLASRARHLFVFYTK